LAFRIDTILLHVDVRGFLGRDAVDRFISIPRDTGEARIANHGCTQRAASRVTCGVRQRAANLARFVPKLTAQNRRLCEVGNLDVVSFAIEIVSMDGQTAGGTIDAGCTRSFLHRRISAHFETSAKRLLNCGRDASRHDVDETARGATPVEQGCRTLDDFDLLRHNRFDAHGMVLAQARDVERSGAVLQYLNAVAAESANDRLTCGWTEISRADAKFTTESFAETCRDLAPQFIPTHDVGGLGDLEWVFMKGRRGDDDLFNTSFLSESDSYGSRSKRSRHGDTQHRVRVHDEFLIKTNEAEDARGNSART
jgi:hypothetical protein